MKIYFPCFCNVIIMVTIVCFPRKEKFQGLQYILKCLLNKQQDTVDEGFERNETHSVKQIEQFFLVDLIPPLYKSSLLFYLPPQFLKMPHSPQKVENLTINQLLTVIKIDSSSIDYSRENENILT